MKSSDKTLQSYITGFGLSVVMTLIAYALVVENALPLTVIVAVIAALAVAQFFTQLLFFLHLGQETGPKWKLLAFGFMAVVVIILVGGSLWIMHNLNYHMFTPEQMNNYVHSQDGL